MPKPHETLEKVGLLRSLDRKADLRVKIPLDKSGPLAVDSVTDLWKGADWLEREVFDMFGIQFEGHPDMKRILLPDGWKGHPLRKDYGIIQQDNEWVQINLGIESGQ